MNQFKANLNKDMDEKSLEQVFNELQNVRNRLDAVENENSSLKKEVNDVKGLNELGQDVATEVINEYNTLKSKGIDIHYLKQKVEKLKVRGKRGLGAKPLTKEEILDVQKVSRSAKEASRKLGVHYGTYKKYARLYGIHTLINFPPPKKVRPKGCLINPYKGIYPIDDILQSKYPNYPVHRLKDKLIRSGKKEGCCEQCGFKERRITDGKIPLLLNFEDGNKKNHSIENLKILCYNCTFLSGHGYIRKGVKQFDPDILQDAKKILPARH